MKRVARDRLPPELALIELGITRHLARGGVGAVEEIRPGFMPEGPPLVLKRYHRVEMVDRSALAGLVRWRRALPASDRAQLDRLATWPLALIVEGDELVGFLMYRVPPQFIEDVRLPSGLRRSVTREAQYLLAAPERMRRLGIQQATLRDRLEIVWTLAEGVAFLHRQRIVLGDVSARNVLWHVAPGRTLLLDCDSVTLGGVGSPLPSAFTVDWDDPAQPDFPAASADVYKLALFAVRALTCSFQTRDPGRDGLESLDAAGRWLVGASLAVDPTARPTADAWERWAAGRRAAARAERAATDRDAKTENLSGHSKETR